MALVDTLTSVTTGAVRWGGAMAAEVVLLPATMRSLREGVVALTALPGQMERLHLALTDATATLEEHVPAVSEVVTGQVAPGIAGLRDRLDRALATIDGLLVTVDPVLAKADRALDRAPDQVDRIEGTVTAVGAQLDTLFPRIGAVLPQLDELLPRLEDLLPKLQVLEVDDLQGRVRHLDEIVSELSDTLVAVLGSIPGVRRSVSAT